MNEDRYGDRFKGNFLTDKVLPFVFVCVFVTGIVWALILWAQGR